MAFMDYDKIVLFGDSITEQSYEQTRGFGFGAALADIYRRKIEVVCRGFSGYNTAHAMAVIPKIIPPPAPTSKIRLITIFFGANDSTLHDRPQHVPLDQYPVNLRRIIRHPLIKAHDPKVILITPSPICEYRTQDGDLAREVVGIQRLAANTKKYADAALEVGKALGIPTVNLWEAFIQYAGGWEEGNPIPGSKELPKNEKLGELLRDGLHFEPKGYQILYDLVLKTIRENIPELDPENLEFVFPRHEEADRCNWYSGGEF
ncbi:SGNH hydrolase [Choiromyces venosus 120613-1]|uniref:SGNH hydrolase n=1 Tax=Choiromyces venosus 120613-1 TaxID=1336337 RepID=A0A3N4JUZ6_9PEZI|nr:SGNH hydrolase [Choiromyces venosus 120613-1]